MLRLHANQSIQLPVHPPAQSLRVYLRQSRRIVYTLMNPSQVEELGEREFRLYLRAIKFLMLNIQPVVDLALHTDAAGHLHLRSVGCEIRGNPFVDQRFDLSLVGHLQPVVEVEIPRLTGRADLTVSVELPPALRMTPKPLLETTGNQLLRGILTTIKQRLTRRLIADYRQWRTETAALESSPIPQSFPNA